VPGVRARCLEGLIAVCGDLPLEVVLEVLLRRDERAGLVIGDEEE
jgi:hypothetical protein